MTNFRKTSRHNELKFDPKDIDITLKQFSLYQIIKRLEKGEIYLDNYFQRRLDLWDNVQQSRFIESLLIRLPIPAFYFAEIDNYQWQVIDGLQRISTLKNFFLEGKLVLSGLEFLTELNGCNIEGVPYDLIRRIEDSYITAYIINKNTPDQIKYIIFDRINTAGLKLSGQEMRHALYRGFPIEFIEKLAKADSFKRATNYSISSKRMLDCEYVNRFLAFYLFLDSYNGDMNNFLNKTLENLTDAPKSLFNEIEDNFEKAMHYSSQIFHENAFRNTNNIGYKKPPLNKALFECISVNFAKAKESTLDLVMSNHGSFTDKFHHLLMDNLFAKSISSGTNNIDKVQYRFHKFNDLINNILDAQ